MQLHQQGIALFFVIRREFLVPPGSQSDSSATLSLRCLKSAALAFVRLLGAEVMSLMNSDENKTFGVVLRTPVDDSTGIPHILEHSVLCGSRKYPIKAGR